MLIISTSCFKGYGLHKIFKLVSEAGLDGLNLDIISGEYDTENALYVKSLSDEFKVPVLSITAYEKKMDSKLVDSLINFAGITGTKLINFYPPHRADKDTLWFSDYLTKAQNKEKDITLSVLNVEPKTFLFFIPEYKDATLTTIKKVTGNTSLSISNVDPSSGVDLIKTFSMLGNTIKNVYLSDKSGTKNEVMLGKGDMPLRDLLGRLKENGYDGIFTIKISPKELGVGDDSLLINRIADAKKYFDKHFTKVN